MRATVKINNKTYQSADYDSNQSGNGLWEDGRQIVGTCDIRPTDRDLKKFAKQDLIEKLVFRGVVEPEYNERGELCVKMRVAYE